METLSGQELVARNVRRVRELRDNLSQAQLARRLTWSKQKLSKLETGARSITVDDLLSLAVALHVAPAVLLVPWEDDESLEVVVRGGARRMGLGSVAAFGWIVGAPEPATLTLMANPVDYFFTTPAPIQRRYGAGWFRRVREELGWTISDDGRHVSSDLAEVHWSSTTEED